jgi:pimeloyl-ACP methyl ester carboxylesterase
VNQPFRQLSFEALPARPSRAHSFLELETKSVEVRSEHFGAVTIRYREYGSGDPLLLVHGLMTSGYSFRYLIEPLGQRYRLIVPDLVGCGESDKPDVGYTAPALARFIGELMHALGLRGCDVVGNSLGGYLCMQLALADAGALDRLVNIHSPGVPMTRLYALRAGLAMPGTRAVLDWVIARDPERWAHRHVHYYDETVKSREEAGVYGAPLATVEGRRAFIHYLADALDPGEMRAFVQKLSRAPFPVPMLLLFAERDPMVPPRVGEALSKLAGGSELAWLEHCSHFMHVDRPEACADAIARFLERQRAPVSEAI